MIGHSLGAAGGIEAVVGGGVCCDGILVLFWYVVVFCCDGILVLFWYVVVFCCDGILVVFVFWYPVFCRVCVIF